jgi:transcriptional regulator GlxA family with amidase domain
MSTSLNIGIVIFNGAEELDFVGPYEVFSILNTLDNKKRVNVFTIAEEKTLVHCANNLKVMPDFSFKDAPKIDVLLIPGGDGRRKEMHNERLRDFVLKTAEKAKYITSVCTGAFILAEAGLLDGRKATTWKGALHELDEYEKIEVIKERFVDEGTVITSAGVTAAIDMALYIVELLFGIDARKFVAAEIEYKY